MAGENESVADVLLKEPVEKPDTSVRGAISAAMDEVKEKAAEREPEPKEVKEPAKPRTVRDEVRKASDEEKPERQQKPEDKAPVERKPVEKAGELDTGKPEVRTPAVKPPPGWLKEAKVEWTTLPPDVQKSVLKREEEFSAGIKQYADKARGYDEYDQAIAPYKQQISSFGVTPAQTIGKLFEWMNALGNPSQDYKVAAFKSLAQSFGLDVKGFFESQKLTADELENQYYAPQVDQETINQAVQQHIAPLQQKFAQQQEFIDQQERMRAEQYFTNWAKDKPYFQQVRTSMYNLIATGEVAPLEDGNPDFDAAYKKAVRLNEDVWTQMQDDAQAQEAAEAQEKARKDAADKAARLQKAQRVGVGIRPTAPSMNVAGYQSAVKPHVPGQKVSVRDSLKQTMQQFREELQ